MFSYMIFYATDTFNSQGGISVYMCLIIKSSDVEGRRPTVHETEKTFSME